LRDPDAAVLHGDDSLPVTTLQPYVDAPGVARVVDGIVEQVVEGLTERRDIDPHGGKRLPGSLVGDLEASVPQAYIEGPQGRVEDLREVRLLEAIGLLAGLDLREVEDVVDE